LEHKNGLVLSKQIIAFDIKYLVGSPVDITQFHGIQHIVSKLDFSSFVFQHDDQIPDFIVKVVVVY